MESEWFVCSTAEGGVRSCRGTVVGTARATDIALAISAALVGKFLLS